MWFNIRGKEVPAYLMLFSGTVVLLSHSKLYTQLVILWKTGEKHSFNAFLCQSSQFGQNCGNESGGLGHEALIPYWCSLGPLT